MERGHPFDYMQTDKIRSLQSTLSTGVNPKNETVSYDTLAGKETASGKETI
jgi:hypothetical protein